LKLTFCNEGRYSSSGLATTSTKEILQKMADQAPTNGDAVAITPPKAVHKMET